MFHNHERWPLSQLERTRDVLRNAEARSRAKDGQLEAMANTLQQKEELLRLSSEECRQLCEKLNTVELLHLNKHAQLSVRVHCTALHCTALHCTALHCTALHCHARLILPLVRSRLGALICTQHGVEPRHSKRPSPCNRTAAFRTFLWRMPHAARATALR